MGASAMLPFQQHGTSSDHVYGKRSM